ncbi:MAG: SoxR reducing system RseC family protein [Candidatus Accumulibacter sp.]|jgi:sigma-E factor negative regulatory protein RseC|nr:SoxR reducing system RseC family protein [Accumulibacter sp.]
MAEVKGTVSALDGDHAFVRVLNEGCGRCHEPGGCGGAHLARAFCASPRVYRVKNPLGARPGEEVAVVIRDRTLLRSAIAGYLLPLLGLFLGAALGLAFAGETGSMAGAAAGLTTAWGIQGTRRVRNFLLGPDPEPWIRDQESGIRDQESVNSCGGSSPQGR